MAEIEDKFGIIPENERIPELEQEVQYHLDRALRKEASNPREYFRPNFRVNKKYTHIVYPEFKPSEIREKRDWEMEEIRRCIHGYDGLPGKYYYYFNHVRIKDKARGKIRPDFRASDLDWFLFLERIQNTTGKGAVCIKRRQVGMSWKASADALHNCSFNNSFEVGMNSKTETDSRNLFKKIKYMHRNVPDFLRPIATATDRRDAMDFSKIVKDQFGNKTRQGTESTIISVAPTATGHAGNQYKELIIDEAGEQPDLLDLWSNAEDCLMRETQRVGTPIIFGTLGDMGKAGKGLQEFWTKHHIYDLERFAFWGYSSMLMDEFGNDDLENSIRWIIYNRKKKEGGSDKVRNKFIQKYPLTEEDAFLSITGAGVGNEKNLNIQYKKLLDNPPHKERGMMRRRPDGGVDFVPHPDGKIIIYERPLAIKDGYALPVDPAEDDDVEKSKDSSNLAAVVFKKAWGSAPKRMVAEYEDRPQKLAEYYEQLAMLCQWYGTKVTIEMNKGGFRMKDYFDIHYPHLLALAPKGVQSARGGFELRHGVKMTADRKNQMMGLIDQYTDEDCEWIPSTRVIEQFKVFGGKGADDDLAVAFGWGLIVLQADKFVARAVGEQDRKTPHYGFKKEGKYILRTDGQNIYRPTTKRTKSAIFR